MNTLLPIPPVEPALSSERPGAPPHYLRLDTDTHGELPVLAPATLIRGRASEALDLLPAECVRTVVTSPPYWSLRDYETGDSFGRDDSLTDYLGSIVADFRKLRRVLTDDGTVWLNIGDAYTLRQPALSGTGQEESGARHERPAPDTARTQAQGFDRAAVATGFRTSG